MQTTEANRARHLLLRLERGEELPSALARALDLAEVRAAWITGAGVLEAAELAVFEAVNRERARPRRFDSGCELVSLTGRLASGDGTTAVRLWATLAREGELGLATFAGELVWARALAVDLMVVALDDSAGRVPLPGPEAGGASGGVAAGGRTGGSPAASAMGLEAPPLPQRPTRPRDETEVYPEIGDRVTHFHFGECEVIGSDGDRIRLRQERDGRVREVALTMLKIDLPTVGEDGRRHFELRRKN
ncbi:MAG TPA: PPC domain-containing DNA-binding protein [Minicystis sp.]|nr:PPC domain-containing DNA-binding protein [Minicystis sp.]